MRTMERDGGETGRSAEFVRRIARFARDRRALSIQAVGTVGDRYALVVYREQPHLGLSGRVFDLDELEGDFDPNAPEDLAWAMIVELEEPSGPGQAGNWAWESDFVGADERVGWHPPTHLPKAAVPTTVRVEAG